MISFVLIERSSFVLASLKLFYGPKTVKYLGKPRGFTVLSVPSKNGRADAGEFNSPRPSRNGSAEIDTRTLGASVRVGGSTSPDNSRLTTPKTRVLRGVAFPRNCRQLLRIKVFNPRRNCIRYLGRMGNKRTAFILWVKWFEIP